MLRLILGVMCLLGLTACMGSLTTPSSPPRYYEVDYPYQPVSCADRIQPSLRVWPLSAVAPYDREEMIILDSARRVILSPQYKWVTFPGTMISNRLLQDLAKNDFYSKVVPAGDPFNASLQLGGNVFEFKWEDTESSARAVLDVEISVWNQEDKRAILFRKHYRYESQSTSKGGPEHFAAAMSGLVERLSMAVRQDICGVMSKGSSSPTGG